MTSHAELLVDLIRYVRGLQPGANEVASIAPADLLADQDLARELAGVDPMPSGDVWLRVRKIPEDPAPEPNVAMAASLAGQIDDPENPPVIVVGDPGQDGADAQHWLDTTWAPWAAATRQVRRSNAFYQDLFHTMTRLKLEGGAEAREVVCGMGMGAWDTPATGALELPMLMQPCEVAMSGHGDGALEIRPAASAPEIALAVFSQANPGAAGLAKEWLNESKWQEAEYTPGDRGGWEGLLRGLALRLDPAAAMVERATPSPNLQVDLRWCFYLRDRPGDRLRRDLDALEELLLQPEGQGDIPVFLKAMVDKAIHCGQKDGEAVAWRGSEQIGRPGQGQEMADLLFPLPYNDEQAQIISHLTSGCGAIVQGPPGTGKSHTIANVICHYLAQGKRVLVAASSADALDVVRDKIPEQVRDLVAALLSSDTESLADFERSIMEIEHRLANLDPAVEQARCEQLQALVEQIHDKIAVIDQDLEMRARKHRDWIEVAGERMSMASVARAWKQGMDEGLEPLAGPVPAVLDPQMEDIVDAARAARRALGPMIDDPQLAEGLPGDVPTSAQVEEALDARDGIEAMQYRVVAGQIWKLAIDDQEQVDLRQGELMTLGEQVGHMQQAQQGFIERFGERWRASMDCVVALEDGDPIIGRLRDIGEQAQAIMMRLRQTDGRVELSGWMSRGEHVGQALEALERLAQGQPAFAWWQAPTRREAKALLDTVMIDEAPPADAGQWSIIKARVDDLLQARTIHTQWNGIAKQIGLGQVSSKGSVSDVMSALAQAWQACDRARQIHGAGRRVDEHLGALFGGVDGSTKDLHGRIEMAIDSIQAGKQAWGLQQATGNWDHALARLAQTGAFGRDVVAEAGSIGDRQQAMGHWTKARARLRELKSLAGTRHELEKLVDKAGELGFGAWARTWLHSGGEIDGQWKRRWQWQEMGRALETMGPMDEAGEMLERRRALVRQLNEAIGAMVAVRAWMGAASSANAQVRRALKDYAGAVRKQGGGQGKRAARHRAAAREAMRQAYAAVPCWIMPHGRVCESLPAEIGLFDLVIIDEASQSDIQALPTLLRGKQLLIVGDDRQVSPAAVGVSEQRVAQWMANDLARQPYAHLVLPERSLYDLFNVVFSGRDVMLREHFRSVEPIIAYSNRNYYHDMIVPLRVPATNERIDPPLVDVVVRDGIYQNGVNLGEARWIGDEIQAILADPSLEGRSIGIVTLTSNDKQAIAIHDELGRREIDMDTWVRRGIAVGPPPRFQGKERDIMFVSMVWDGRNRREGASNSQQFRQAFNVAMSRARDRLYLVRSNEGRAFRPDSILGQVVAHLQPSNHMPSAGLRPDGQSFPDLLARELMARGYVVVGDDVPDGVDMVLDDVSGARLAIACDGHMTPGMGPQWTDAMRRQRVLERAGWTVWRGFEPHFIMDPDAFMERVERAAATAGVRPGGGDQGQRLAVVERRTVGQPVDPGIDELADKGEDDGGWPDDPQAWPQDLQTLGELCDSPFEREVLAALLGRGYRVRPQYPCAGYRIDMVVQGPDGVRMAIECDGDSHHGLDKLEADRARQAWLEQAQGLGFWRCWYSDWRDDRAGSLDRLWSDLASAGVKPWP